MSDFNFENLKALSKLSLTKEEEVVLPSQIDSILEYVDQLQEAKVEMKHGSRQALLPTDLRSDEPQETDPVVRERLFENMPKSDGDYLEVPEVFAE